MRKVFAVLLAGLIFAGAVSALAAAGGSDNPLVTLSYLTDTFTKNILNQTQSKINSTQSTYEAKLDAKLSGLSGSGGSGAAAYSVVDLSSGQTLTGRVGCEIMLRVGTATCVSSGTPGLIDTTTGGTLENGGSLVKNHLYLVTIDTRSIRATSAVKVLVRGPYSIT